MLTANVIRYMREFCAHVRACQQRGVQKWFALQTMVFRRDLQGFIFQLSSEWRQFVFVETVGWLRFITMTKGAH